MSTATVVDRVSKDEADVRAFVAATRDANHTKDAAGFARRYASDAVVFNLAPPLAHHGIDVEEKRAWFDTWDGPVDLEARDFSVTVSGDFAFCHGFYRMSATQKASGQAVDFWMRETLCLERDGDGWRIVHEHTSVPFYMDGSLRPAFDLKP